MTPAQILVSSTIKVLMAALRHERTRPVLLRTDIQEFINRKQRGSVRGSHAVTDWDQVRRTGPPNTHTRTFTQSPPNTHAHTHLPHSFCLSHPSTLLLLKQLFSPQSPRAVIPAEAPIRPVKHDLELLMEPLKYHRFENPYVINIPGSLVSISILCTQT